MSALTITEKSLPSLRLAAATHHVATQPEVAAVVGPLFDRVADALTAAGHQPGLPVAEYDMDENGVRITVGFVHDGPPVAGIDLVDLAAAVSALSGVHLGAMSSIDHSWDAVFRAVDEGAWRAEGPCREVYLASKSEDQADWVTELQQPVTRA